MTSEVIAAGAIGIIIGMWLILGVVFFDGRRK